MLEKQGEIEIKTCKLRKERRKVEGSRKAGELWEVFKVC